MLIIRAVLIVSFTLHQGLGLLYERRRRHDMIAGALHAVSVMLT